MEPFPHFRKGSNILETSTISEKGQNSSTKMVKKGLKFLNKKEPFQKRVNIPQQK